jgi:uncharacterized integral membrane protein
MEVSLEAQQYFVLSCATLSILFGLFNVYKIMQVKLTHNQIDEERLDFVTNDANKHPEQTMVENKMIEISELIQQGATTFLIQEYKFVGIFVAIFALCIAVAVEPTFGVFYTTFPFVLGALTSVVSGFIAMQIAVRANVRTAK